MNCLTTAVASGDPPHMMEYMASDPLATKFYLQTFLNEFSLLAKRMFGMFGMKKHET